MKLELESKVLEFEKLRFAHLQKIDLAKLKTKESIFEKTKRIGKLNFANKIKKIKQKVNLSNKNLLYVQDNVQNE